MTDEQKIKQQAIDALRRRVEEQQEQLGNIDERLLIYYTDLCEYSSVVLGDTNDRHNAMELLGALRLLRFLRTYEFNAEDVRQVIYDGEGEWRLDGKRWRHVRGGVKQPGRQQPMVYRWEPFQIFMLVAIYGPMAWIDTEIDIDSRDLLDTERENPETGHIEDLRRLCTRFILFGPRKINKSGFSAFVLTEDFMRGDNDAQMFCTANSLDQAKILYRKTQDMIRSFDPQEKRIRFTATETNWKTGQFRQAQMKALPAGGKIPDGWFASTVAPDEFGSAEYTNGHSDMGQTVATAESSMGPRRQPLTIMTTTASLIQAGPFMEILSATHKLLEEELLYDTGEKVPELAQDRQMCILFEPDEWERNEEYLLTSKPLRRKINPMLGLIAQHSFYDTQVAESRMDDTKKKETIAKLFNVYQGISVSEWIKAEEVRPLQREMRIDDCTKDKGWVIFCGLDFSQGDDLHTASFLAARKHPSGRGTEFFADCDCWVKESTAEKSSIRPLYEQWVKEGWLHYSPGKIFQPALFIQRLEELLKKGCQFMYFGYDKYQSQDPINSLKAFLQSNMRIANPDPYVQVVSQLNSEFNAPTDYLYSTMFAPIPFTGFSNNPLWPWCFGNCVLEIDGRSNQRPVKRSQTDSCKVDPVQAIIMAMDLYLRYESQMH